MDKATRRIDEEFRGARGEAREPARQERDG